MREHEKWYGEAEMLSLREMSAYTIEHVNELDWFMEELWPRGNAAE